MAAIKKLSNAVPVLIGVLAICIANAARADDGLRASPEQTAFARDICTTIMRIRPGVVPFDGCVESLSGTLSSQMQNEILTESYRDCLDSGQKDGTPEFAACVLDRKSDHSTAWNKNPSGMVPKGTPVSLSEPKSYFESSADERRRKEEYSCARLGMLPGSAGFGQCVARLDAALQYAD